jgi:hypothetical protein
MWTFNQDLPSWTNWFHVGLMGIDLARLTIDGRYFRQNCKEKLGTIREIKNNRVTSKISQKRDGNTKTRDEIYNNSFLM